MRRSGDTNSQQGNNRKDSKNGDTNSQQGNNRRDSNGKERRDSSGSTTNSKRGSKDAPPTSTGKPPTGQPASSPTPPKRPSGGYPGPAAKPQAGVQTSQIATAAPPMNSPEPLSLMASRVAAPVPPWERSKLQSQNEPPKPSPPSSPRRFSGGNAEQNGGTMVRLENTSTGPTNQVINLVTPDPSLSMMIQKKSRVVETIILDRTPHLDLEMEVDRLVSVAKVQCNREKDAMKSKYEAEFENMKKRYEDEIARLHKEVIEPLKAALAKLEKENTQLKADLQEALNAAMENRKYAEDLQNKSGGLQEELDRYLEMIKDLQDQLEYYKSLLKELEEAKRLADENDQSTSEKLLKALQENEELQRENDELRDKIDELNDKIRELNELIEELRKTILDQQDELDELRNFVEVSEATIHDLKEAIEKSNETIAKLRAIEPSHIIQEARRRTLNNLSDKELALSKHKSEGQLPNLSNYSNTKVNFDEIPKRNTIPNGNTQRKSILNEERPSKRNTLYDEQTNNQRKSMPAQYEERQTRNSIRKSLLNEDQRAKRNTPPYDDRNNQRKSIPTAKQQYYEQPVYYEQRPPPQAPAPVMVQSQSSCFTPCPLQQQNAQQCPLQQTLQCPSQQNMQQDLQQNNRPMVMQQNTAMTVMQNNPTYTGPPENKDHRISNLEGKFGELSDQVGQLIKTVLKQNINTNINSFESDILQLANLTGELQCVRKPKDQGGQIPGGNNTNTQQQQTNHQNGGPPPQPPQDRPRRQS